MNTAEKTRYTISEYLEFEEKSQQKHEYHNGLIVAMSGGTKIHSKLSARMITAFSNELKDRSCDVYTGDLKILSEKLNSYYYPDCAVVCQDDISNNEEHTIAETNPTLIVEVLSESSELFDRGDKFYAYRTIPSLREYVLVSQNKPLIEVYSRTESEFWRFSEARGIDKKIKFHSVDVEMELSEIYEGISFE